MASPTSRRIKNALTKSFDSSASPIYVLNSAWEILYVNEALLRWAKCTIEDIVGVKCIYSSPPNQSSNPDRASTSADHRFHGLAPPPQSIKVGKSQSGEQVYLSSPEGPIRRCCEFLALASLEDPETPDWIVCVLGAEDTNNEGSESLSSHLHLSLAALQHQLQKRFYIDSLIGESDFAARLRKQAIAAGNNELEMTIAGPPGSGRQHLARTIHQYRCRQANLRSSGNINFETAMPTADRDDRSFNRAASTSAMPGLSVVLQGGLADAQLIQSSARQAIAFAKEVQLERGSKTSRRVPVAWLVVINADQLSAEAQTELWATLTDPRSDVRVIATAEVDLITAADNGMFHHGLAWRISTLVLETGALTRRADDIPLLAQYFVEQSNQQRKQQIGGFDSQSIEALTEYHWPGNLDELRSVVTKAADACSTSMITKADLPQSFFLSLSALRVGRYEQTQIDLDQYLAKIESQLVSRALRFAKGNKTKTAKLLGINRAKLLRRIQYLGLETETQIANMTQDSDKQSVENESVIEFQPVDQEEQRSHDPDRAASRESEP